MVEIPQKHNLHLVSFQLEVTGIEVGTCNQLFLAYKFLYVPLKYL